MDYALRDYEDAWNYDSAAVEAQQTDAVAHAHIADMERNPVTDDERDEEVNLLRD